MRFLLPFIVLLAVLHPAPSIADGAITATATAVKLYRGATIIAASDPNHATYRAGFTPEACRALLTERWQAEAKTRTSGSIQYKCQIEERATVKFQAAPPPPPALAAPGGLTATAQGTTSTLVRWNVVPDAVAYSLRRCLGASCTDFTQLSCIQALQRAHGALQPGQTVRYQVAASRDASCAQVGTLSGIVSTTTLTEPVEPTEPAPPTACAGSVCKLNWTHDGPVADGFRVVYGRRATELTQVAQVTPGNVRATELRMPATGVWYFGVKAFFGGTESAPSNIVAVTVQ